MVKNRAKKTEGGDRRYAGGMPVVCAVVCLRLGMPRAPMPPPMLRYAGGMSVACLRRCGRHARRHGMSPVNANFKICKKLIVTE